MQTIVILLSGFFVILSYVAIIDATILLTKIQISNSLNHSSFPQGFSFGTASSAYQVLLQIFQYIVCSKMLLTPNISIYCVLKDATVERIFDRISNKNT